MKISLRVPARIHPVQGDAARWIRRSQMYAYPRSFNVLPALVLTLIVAGGGWATVFGSVLVGTSTAARTVCLYGWLGAATIAVMLSSMLVWDSNNSILLHGQDDGGGWLVTWGGGGRHARGITTDPGTYRWYATVWAAVLASKLVKWPLPDVGDAPQ